MKPNFEDIVALQPQHGVLLRAIRALIHRLHPETTEVSRPGDRAVSWGFGERKMSEAYAYAMPFRDHVNLGFYRGAFLCDPESLLKGTGKALRHVSFKEAATVDAPAIEALLREAMAEQRRFLEARGAGTK